MFLCLFYLVGQLLLVNGFIYLWWGAIVREVEQRPCRRRRLYCRQDVAPRTAGLPAGLPGLVGAPLVMAPGHGHGHGALGAGGAPYGAVPPGYAAVVPSRLVPGGAAAQGPGGGVGWCDAAVGAVAIWVHRSLRGGPPAPI